jgi:hypothetical protein
MEVNGLSRHSVLGLKAGDLVEVRSREEILATLDKRGSLDNLPFMPEMLEYCGRKLRVWRRADKTCDPGHDPWSIRRMKDAVHLEHIRCDGAGHDGCQAGCLIFWKEAWLKRADLNTVAVESLRPPAVTREASTGLFTINDLFAASQKQLEGETVYTCQATELSNFTSDMAWWDPRQYLRDLRSGNLASGVAGNSKAEGALELALALVLLLRASLVGIYNGIQKRRRSIRYPHVQGDCAKTPLETLDLQAGELVEVRSKEEILATLDYGNRNRGLWFDVEMVRYCGGIYRVLRRVNRIINERTGKMLSMKNPCIILEGVWCESDYHRFCPRAILHYWRESWLRRAAVTAPDFPVAQQESLTCASHSNPI